MVGHLSIEVSVSLETLVIVVCKDLVGDDFLPLSLLGCCLSIVFAQVLIVGGAETNDALLSFVAHINAYKHRLFRDLWSELHPPEVSS